MFLKSNLVYIAEDAGIADIDWFIDYCTDYHADLVWCRGTENYCCPNDGQWLVDNFRKYVIMLDRNNPTNEIDV
jgi:hypothetical protein